jgi:hypothetical protein
LFSSFDVLAIIYNQRNGHGDGPIARQSTTMATGMIGRHKIGVGNVCAQKPDCVCFVSALDFFNSIMLMEQQQGKEH